MAKTTDDLTLDELRAAVEHDHGASTALGELLEAVDAGSMPHDATVETLRAAVARLPKAIRADARHNLDALTAAAAAGDPWRFDLPTGPAVTVGPDAPLPPGMRAEDRQRLRDAGLSDERIAAVAANTRRVA